MAATADSHSFSPFCSLRSWHCALPLVVTSAGFREPVRLLQGDGSDLVETKDYLEIEKAEAAKCRQLFDHIHSCERQNPVSLKVQMCVCVCVCVRSRWSHTSDCTEAQQGTAWLAAGGCSAGLQQTDLSIDRLLTCTISFRALLAAVDSQSMAEQRSAVQQPLVCRR